MNRKVPGFSLIEMAIVLVIVGLVGGVALPSLRVMVDRQKTSTTLERQEKILYALAGYALQHGALPNAARAEHPSGAEDKESKLCRGIVPYATLGLPESFAKDGHHHWFTYVVEKEYTQRPPGIVQDQREQCEQSFCRFVAPTSKLPEEQSQQPTLRIALGHGQTVPIAVAVISHGPEGCGAPNSPVPPRGEDEGKNTTQNTNDIPLVDRDFSKDPQHPFSHKVVWATASNLMAIYGRTPCPPPKLPPTVHREGPHPGKSISQTPQTEAELLPQQQLPAEQEGGHVIEQQAPENTEPPLILRGAPRENTQSGRFGREEY
jgi:prepilin-type N-terminal cleavage/methylation domain-containing protein